MGVGWSTRDLSPRVRHGRPRPLVPRLETVAVQPTEQDSPDPEPASYGAAMQAALTCTACGTTEGTYGSYEEWSDRASELGWEIGEEEVICAACVEAAITGQGQARNDTGSGRDRDGA
jgi:hypothetical protein